MDWFPRWWEKKEEDLALPPKRDTRTLHHKVYEIATANYNPFSVGGSENAQCKGD